MAATSRDVARLAGVSVATVSRVFSNENVVKDATRDKVLEAAAQLHYTPNSVARSLKSSRSRTVGLVVPNIFNPHYFRVAAIIANELDAYGYKLLLSFYRKRNEDELSVLQSLAAAQVEALLFTPLVVNKEIPALLARSSLYSLQIHNNLYSHIDSIKNDDVRGMEFITQYLIDRGHRDIMLITPDRQREKGVSRVLKQNGLPVRPDMFVFTVDMAPDAEKVERAILEARLTAIIMVAQEAKMTVLGILKKHKLRFPQDISLIGYDDDSLSEYLGITTMGHDMEYISREISEFLLDHLLRRTRDSGVQHRLMDTMFIERSSVAKLEK